MKNPAGRVMDGKTVMKTGRGLAGKTRTFKGIGKIGKGETRPGTGIRFIMTTQTMTEHGKGRDQRGISARIRKRMKSTWTVALAMIAQGDGTTTKAATRSMRGIKASGIPTMGSKKAQRRTLSNVLATREVRGAKKNTGTDLHAWIRRATGAKGSTKSATLNHRS